MNKTKAALLAEVLADGGVHIKGEGSWHRGARILVSLSRAPAIANALAAGLVRLSIGTGYGDIPYPQDFGAVIGSVMDVESEPKAPTNRERGLAWRKLDKVDRRLITDAVRDARFELRSKGQPIPADLAFMASGNPSMAVMDSPYLAEGIARDAITRWRQLTELEFRRRVRKAREVRQIAEAARVKLLRSFEEECARLRAQAEELLAQARIAQEQARSAALLLEETQADVAAADAAASARARKMQRINAAVAIANDRSRPRDETIAELARRIVAALQEDDVDRALAVAEELIEKAPPIFTTFQRAEGP